MPWVDVDLVPLIYLKIGIPDDNIAKWDMAETAKGGPFKKLLIWIFSLIVFIYLNQSHHLLIKKF